MGAKVKWRLDILNAKFSEGKELPPMTEQEIKSAIAELRKNNYPKPEDCPERECSVYRPACKMGICRIAVGMYKDF